MKISDRYIACCILISGVLLFASRASAEISYRSITFKPFMELFRTHDSNIYLGSSSEQPASVSLFRFGTDIVFPVRTHLFNVSYNGDATIYSERPDDNNTLQHSIGADIHLDFPSGIYSTMKDKYRSAADPAPYEHSDPVKRSQNDLYYSLGMKWSSRLATHMLYENTYIDYLKESYRTVLNRRENQVGVESVYSITPKSKVIGTYKYGYMDFMQNTAYDSSTHYIGGGLRGKLTGKTSVESRAGIKSRAYRERGSDDFTLLVLGLGMVTDFSERTKLEVEMFRDTGESYFTRNPYYIQNYAGVQAQHVFLRDINVGLKAQYVNDRFPNAIMVNSEPRIRKDTRYYAGISCEFKIMQWLFLNESYKYGVRDSNIDAYDYTDHFISFGVRAKY